MSMGLSAMCTTPSAEPRRAAEVVELLECVEHVRKKRRVEILQPATFEQEFASVTSAMEALSPAIAKARQQQDQQPGITSALSEAESLLAQLAKEQLVGSIENVKKKQRADMMAEAVQSATLEQKIASATSAIDVLSPVIAKAEYDQLVSPWIISGARNLHAALATERLRAAANYAQEKGSLDYLQSAIAKADNERLVDDFDLAEARAQLSTMATEELKAAMAHAKAKSQVAGLLSGVAKAKQGGLVDASALFEAEALLPVVAAEELDAAAKRAKVRGELDILSLAVGKAEREELVAAPALSEAKALMPAVATEELRVAMKSAKQLRALQPAIAKSREGKLVDASVVAEAMALVPAVASEELHAAMQQARWHIQSNAHRSTTAASFTESKLRSVITAAENGEGGLTGLTHLRRNVFNVPTYTFRATILFGAKAADTGVADNSGCILSRLRPSLRFPRPFSLKVKRLIWDYAGVRHGPVWDRIDAAHSVLTASIGEANRLPATMATEELSRAIKRARDTDRPRALRTAIAAAEKEQLADASVIEEARALLPVAESALIVELKKLQEVDKEDDPGLYMHKQGDLSWGMRAILIDWLVEVVRVKGMNPNIIYMCVNLIDRYLAANQVLRGRLQLVGITALYVTCKEDFKTETISADTCAYLTAGAYTKEEVLEMEEKLMPCCHQYRGIDCSGYLDVLVQCAEMCAGYDLSFSRVGNRASYFSLRLLVDQEWLGHRPSLIMMSAVFLATSVEGENPCCARHLSNESLTNEGLEADADAVKECPQWSRLLSIAGFDLEEVLSCARTILKHVKVNKTTKKNKELTAVRNMFRSSAYLNVAEENPRIFKVERLSRYYMQQREGYPLLCIL